MKLKTTKTQNITIMLALLAIISIVGLVFWCSLIMSNAEQLRVDKKEYREELDSSISLVEIKKRFDFVDRSISFFDDVYIKGNEIANFVTYLEQLAQDSGVILSTESIDTSKERDGSEVSADPGVLDIRLSVNGEWRQVNTFLLALENVPYHINITEMKLNSFGNGEGWVMNMSFEGITD